MQVQTIAAHDNDISWAVIIVTITIIIDTIKVKGNSTQNPGVAIIILSYHCILVSLLLRVLVQRYSPLTKTVDDEVHLLW